jgi:hypothetical protein
MTQMKEEEKGAGEWLAVIEDDRAALALPGELREVLASYAEELSLPQDEHMALQKRLLELAHEPVEKPWFSWFFWQGMLATCGAACLLLVVPLLHGEQGALVPSTAKKRAFVPVQQHRGLIAKGHSIHLDAIGHATQFKRKIRVRNNEILYSGDQIQFSYLFPGKNGTHIVIASLEQSGRVSVYLSGKQGQSLLVRPRKGAFPVWELDDTLGRERIWVLTSTKPFAVRSVKAALKRAFRRAKGVLSGIRRIDGDWQTSWTALIQKRQAPVKR